MQRAIPAATLPRMNSETTTALATAAEHSGYQPPSFEVISLDCEITSYAPDGDQPLF